MMTQRDVYKRQRKETLSTKRNVKSVNSLATVLRKELFPSKNNKHEKRQEKATINQLGNKEIRKP